MKILLITLICNGLFLLVLILAMEFLQALSSQAVLVTSIFFGIVLLSCFTMLFFLLRHSHKEPIEITYSFIRSQKFGEIPLANIKSYKISKFRWAETIHLKLNTDLLLVISPIVSGQTQRGTDYDDFKQFLLKSMAQENDRRKQENEDLIYREKSILYRVFFIAVLIVLVIAVLFKFVFK